MAEEKEKKKNGEGETDPYERERVQWVSEVRSLPWLLSDLLGIVADYSFGLPKFKWYSIDADDYWCDYGDTSIHVERMSRDWWWFAVYGNGPLKHVEHNACWETNGFPNCTTWRDACLFGEMIAEHLNTHGNANIFYLTHTSQNRIAIEVISPAPPEGGDGGESGEDDLADFPDRPSK